MAYSKQQIHDIYKSIIENKPEELKIFLNKLKRKEGILGFMGKKRVIDWGGLDSPNGDPILLVAASLDFPEITETLISFGVKINARNSNKNTALAIAADRNISEDAEDEEGNFKNIALLLKHGAVFDKRDNFLTHELFNSAVQNGEKEIARILSRKKDFDPQLEAKDNSGFGKNIKPLLKERKDLRASLNQQEARSAPPVAAKPQKSPNASKALMQEMKIPTH
jgi:ankyrin repeat protein